MSASKYLLVFSHISGTQCDEWTCSFLSFRCVYFGIEAHYVNFYIFIILFDTNSVSKLN